MTDGLHTYTIQPPTPLPWMDDRACDESTAHLFHPEGANSAIARAVERLAVAICKTCPVAAECLEHALAHDERYGVWGGATEHERHLMRRSR